MMQRRSAAVALFGWGWALAAHAQVQDLHDAINKAGRQRMLSQRMWKAYVALGLDVLPAKAADVLAKSIDQFERQLAELKAFALKPDIKATYQLLEKAWTPYKAVLTGERPARERAPQLPLLANQVLALAHQGTSMLETISGKPSGRLVNLAGRQRMLSQRLAALYMMAAWGVHDDKTAAELNQALEEFKQAHHILRSAPEATPAILSELSLVEAQFVFFSNSLRQLNTNAAAKNAAIEVFTTSERILQVMDHVTGLYAAHPST